MTEEEAEYQARVYTARRFNLPLWMVDMNHICYEKDVEWFFDYGKEEEAKSQRFNLPPWVVDIDHICCEKDVVWFVDYE